MEQRLFVPFFAHPIGTYGTRLEAALTALIIRHFDICEGRVENPSEPHHEEDYKLWAARNGDIRLMNYFHEEVFPECDGSVALLFRDGRMGIDVADSTQWFIRESLPTFVISATGEVTATSLRRFEANCRCGLFTLRQMTEEERALVLANSPQVVIPHKKMPEFYPD